MIEHLESRIAPAGILNIVSKNGVVVVTEDAKSPGAQTLGITPTMGGYSFAPDATTALRINGTLFGAGVTKDVTGFLKSLAVKLGKGDDNLTATITTAAALAVDLGDGLNAFTLQNSTLASVKVKAAAADDTVLIKSSTVTGAVTVDAGGGTNSITFQNDTLGSLTVLAGAGNDTLSAPTSSVVNIGGKFTAKLGDGNNTMFWRSASSVGGEASITSGKGTDTLSFDQGGNLIFGKGLTVSSGAGKDQILVNLGGVFTVGKNLKFTSLGGGPGANVAQSVTVSFGVSIGGKASFTAKSQDNIVQTLKSSFRTLSAGAVNFSADAPVVTQLLSAVEPLTVQGAISLLAKATTTATQTVTSGLNGGASGSLLKGPVKITGGSAITLDVQGDVLGPVTLTMGANFQVAVMAFLAPSVKVGNTDGTYSGRILGPLTIKSADIAQHPTTIQLQNFSLFGVLAVTTGAGDTVLSLDDVQTTAKVLINTGAGNDDISFDTNSALAKRGSYLAQVSLTTGAGADTITFGDSLANTGVDFYSTVVFPGLSIDDLLQLRSGAFFLIPAVS